MRLCTGVDLITVHEVLALLQLLSEVKTFVDTAGTSRIISRRLARIPGQHSGLHNLSRLLCSMHTELFGCICGNTNVDKTKL
jgi:hypothetical protein